MRKLFTLAAVLVALLPAAAPAAKKAEPKKPDAKQMEEYTRLQIFLDNANFGPGKLDGRDGVFTRKALALYRAAQGQAPAAPADPKAPMDLSGLDLSSVEPVFTEYTITKEDVASVGQLPSGPEAQSKAKWLPYATLAEALAEKFHSDLKFIKELN